MRSPASVLSKLSPARLAGLLGLVVLSSNCGSTPATMNVTPAVCGNGIKEPGEDCDLGAQNGQLCSSCSATCKTVKVNHPAVNVIWELVKHTTVASYMGTNCSAVGADNARIHLSGPSIVDLEESCASYQRTISGACVTTADGQVDCSSCLKPGTYQATVTLTRASDGTAVTIAVSSGTVQLTGRESSTDPVKMPIDIRQEDFLLQYTGSLNLQTSWGGDGVKCDGASPRVTRESLVLQSRDDVPPLKTRTIPGTPLDGSSQSACFIPGVAPNQNRIYEEAMDLPWGPYRLRVRGYAAGSQEPEYCGAYDVFVGPGRNTLPWNITVPRAYKTDAGLLCP